MATGRKLTTREKVIAAITIVLGVVLLVHYLFLGTFIEDYRRTSMDLADLEVALEKQRTLLAEEAGIDRRYKELEGVLPQREPSKSPQAVFIEDISRFCGAGTEISPHRVIPVPDAREFAYIQIDVSKVSGNMRRISEVLRGFYRRNLLVRELNISVDGGRVGSNPNLELRADIAQLVRVEDLDEADRETVRERREDDSGGGSSGYSPIN